MEKLEDLKKFILERRNWVIGGITGFLLLGIIIAHCFLNVTTKEDKSLLGEDKQEILKVEEEKGTEECHMRVDIKGEVVVPGLYELVCDSRVQDVIDLAGGLTEKADTSVLNLSQKITDEMVVVVYSKVQVSNFITTKKEEQEKQAACQTQQEIKNDACIKEETIVTNSIIDNHIGDTPVKVLISLNTASKIELTTLPGIGESKAELIIQYRKEHGSFKEIEEIKNVKGIGDKIFEKIKDSITV